MVIENLTQNITENASSILASPDFYNVCREYGSVFVLTSPIFIVMLLALVFTCPFAVIGVMSLWTRVKNWLRQREGWIRVRKKLSNYHWTVFWAKPTGRKVKIKGEEGFEFEIPIQKEGGMMALEQEYNRDPNKVTEELERRTEDEAPKPKKKGIFRRVKEASPIEFRVEDKDPKSKLTPEQIAVLRELVK